jgi:hypothetical protein
MHIDDIVPRHVAGMIPAKVIIHGRIVFTECSRSSKIAASPT